MKPHKVKVQQAAYITHDVMQIVTDKPQNYHFEAGQATSVAINKPGYEQEGRPFTFTSLDTGPHLEFIIKTYPGHDGVTDKFGEIQAGDELFVGDVFGAIRYKGPGYFIAGGAGVTPFVAMLRKLKKEGKLEGHTLIFANKRKEDIILKEELEEMLGDKLILPLSREKAEGHPHGRIDKDFLKTYVTDWNAWFYVCSTPEMTKTINQYLKDLGVKEEKIVYEH